MTNNIHPLNTSWVLWYHNPIDKNWNKESYLEISNIKTVEKFWLIYDSISSSQIENGMLFIMRENIFPRWEDEKNKNGGCWSFKIPKNNVYNVWMELCISLIGENLMKNIKNTMDINGVSISPKKGFSIIKIWNSNNKNNDKSLLTKNISFLDIESCFYKTHQ